MMTKIILKQAINILSYILLVVACFMVLAQETEPPEQEEQSVQEICQFLITTDKDLVEKYKASPKGEGEAIMALVRQYNDALASIVRKYMNEKRNNVTSTVTDAQALIDHGGPEFINFYVERPILEERFGINNVSSRILCCQRQNAIDLWQDFYKVYSKISDTDDEV
uniref:Secreted protein n=1 Tax=Homalodisca liturata TaxID=320908 RepID=A0A1B6IEI4_9HEMI